MRINQSIISSTKIGISLFSLFGFILFFSPFILVSHAQQATDSAQSKTVSLKVLGEQATNEGILSSTVDQKLEELKKDIASKAATLKTEVNRKIENKAVVGKVTAISTDSITLESSLGTRTIKMNEYTLFQDGTKQKSKKPYSQDQIKEADFLISLGDMDEKGVMLAKKVIKTDQINPSSSTYFYGQVKSVGDLTFVLNLDTQKGESEKTISFNPSTVLQDGKGSGDVNAIKIGRTVVTVTRLNKEINEARFIYLLPITGMIKPVSLLSK